MPYRLRKQLYVCRPRTSDLCRMLNMYCYPCPYCMYRLHRSCMKRRRQPNMYRQDKPCNLKNPPAHKYRPYIVFSHRPCTYNRPDNYPYMRCLCRRLTIYRQRSSRMLKQPLPQPWLNIYLRRSSGRLKQPTHLLPLNMYRQRKPSSHRPCTNNRHRNFDRKSLILRQINNRWRSSGKCWLHPHPLPPNTYRPRIFGRLNWLMRLLPLNMYLCRKPSSHRLYSNNRRRSFRRLRCLLCSTYRHRSLCSYLHRRPNIYRLRNFGRSIRHKHLLPLIIYRQRKPSSRRPYTNNRRRNLMCKSQIFHCSTCRSRSSCKSPHPPKTLYRQRNWSMQMNLPVHKYRLHIAFCYR